MTKQERSRIGGASKKNRMTIVDAVKAAAYLKKHYKECRDSHGKRRRCI